MHSIVLVSIALFLLSSLEPNEDAFQISYILEILRSLRSFSRKEIERSLRSFSGEDRLCCWTSWSGKDFGRECRILKSGKWICCFLVFSHQSPAPPQSVKGRCDYYICCLVVYFASWLNAYSKKNFLMQCV